MRSFSLRPSHHLPLVVVCLRSGKTISARAYQGILWASWRRGCVGVRSIVTGCARHGVFRPEEQMLIGVPSLLFSLCWPPALFKASLGSAQIEFRASDYLKSSRAETTQ